MSSMHCAYCGYAYKGHDEFGIDWARRNDVLRTAVETPDFRTCHCTFISITFHPADLTMV